MKGYLGIDIGSISTKGVVIDENLEIVASFFALDLSGMERNGILTIGLRPKNFMKLSSI